MIKRVRHFEDLGGEDAIVIHRLLKNSVKGSEYLLMTEAFWETSGGLEGESPMWLTEECEGIGPVRIAVLPTEGGPAPEHRRAPMTRPDGVFEMMRLTMRGLIRRMTQQHTFSRVPA